MKTHIIAIMSLLTSIATAQVPDSPQGTKPLEMGMAVPPAVVQDIDGNTVNLAKLVREQPTVLIFYRGSWCPYCNRHLAELADIEDELKEAGYQIVAISPDKPEGLKTAAESNELGYQLLSDSSATAMKAFGLAFRVDDETIKRYKEYGINLEDASGESHHILPVPAVYIVDGEGIIRLKYSDPNYKVRLSASGILAAAKAYAPSDKE